MMLFTEFLSRLGVTLEPGQRVVCKVMLDRVNPRDLPPEDQEIARTLFGPVSTIPDAARTICCLVAGGRSGKTYLFSLYMLYAALTVDVSHLAPGEVAFGAIIAPSLDLAQQDLNYATGAAESDKAIRQHIIPTGKSELQVRQRKDGKVVSIRPFAASRGGVSGRGKSLISVLMSETCFFKDETTGVVNDEHIFKAASPRVVPGGLTLIESTPWTSSGLLWRLYKENFMAPSIAVVAQAHTATMRNNPHILSIVEREFARDPDNARIEFGAQWGSSSSVTFFTDEDVNQLFDPDYALPPAATPGDTVAAATDLGFVRNSAVLATLVRKSGSDVQQVLTLKELRPETQPLVPTEVCASFADALKVDHLTSVVADGHYRESLREYTAKAGIHILESCGPAERFTVLRAAIRTGKVKMHATHPLAGRLRKQLLGIKAAQLSGGELSIKLPKDIDGSHGDVADCLARAVWGMQHYAGNTVPEPEVHTYSPFEEAMERKLATRNGEEDWWRG